MKRFLFYDTETSGLSPSFDQVLTFACIQTDQALNELSRQIITVNLRPDIVPSPGAFLTHGLTPEVLEDGIPEYDAALRIHQLFNTPDTVSLGYNSLGFDDEFLRFLFYRNLLDPYSHQYASGCSRMDLLPVAAIYKLFCNQVLSWPVLEGGKPTLKLEHLSSANRFVVSGKAHEAMADVEALLSLARIFQKEKKIWDYALGFFNKHTDIQRMQGLKAGNAMVETDFQMGIMVSVSFGADRNYMAPVLCLGESEPYKNQTLWLRLDKPGLFDVVDEETGNYDFFVIRKRPADQLFILPCLERFWTRLSPEAADICLENLNIIRSDASVFHRTAAWHRAFKYPDLPDVDADAALYQAGFFSPPEKKDIALFHRTDAADKYLQCNELATPRVKTLARRILVRSFGVPVSDIPEFSDHLKGLSGQSDVQVKGYKGDEKFTCVQALAELARIEKEAPSKNVPGGRDAMVAWLKSYIGNMSSALVAGTF